MNSAGRAPITPSAIAAIARAIYTRGPPLTRVLQHWRAFVCPLELVIEEVPPGSTVLDVGCGGGLLLGALATMGRIGGGLGFDFSADGIRTASAMAESIAGDTGLHFQQLSAVDPWPQGEFTVVALIDVMHHIPVASQRDVIRKAARIIKPGARLVYKDIAQRPRWRAWANTLHDLILSRQWAHYVPTAAIQEWAAAEGLVLVRSYSVNRLWYGHEFAVFVRPE